MFSGVPNVSYYRKGFQSRLPEIFSDLNQCYNSIESRIRAEAFKQRVMNCFRAWEDWALYPQDYLIKLQNIFLGFVPTQNRGGEDSKVVEEEEEDAEEEEDDDVDGVPLDGAALLKNAAQKSGSVSSGSKKPTIQREDSGGDSDVDGVPMPASNGKARSVAMPAGFVPSKWETVDPDEVQAQAVTSKWDIFDQDDAMPAKRGHSQSDEDDIDGVPLNEDGARMDESARQRLREIEVRVMCYQDDLESGKEPLRSGWNIAQQVEYFRKRLLQSDDSDPETSSRSKRSKKSRRRSSSSSRSRSRSRERTSRGGHRSRTDSSSDEGSGRRSSKRSSRRSRSPRKSKKRRY